MSNSSFIPGDGVCNFTIEPSKCTFETCCVSRQGQMQYIPALGSNAAYAAIFGLMLIPQIWFGIRYKTWSFMAWMSLGLIGELAGYIGRIMLHQNIFSFNAFLTYLIPLTIAPAFITASIYLCLARLVVIYDPELKCSRLKPMTYTKIFVTCDFISLVLQGAGGGLAATASDEKGPDLGVNVMIAGLATQVISIVLFIAVCTDFTWRLRKNRSHRVTESTSHLGQMRNRKWFKGFIFALIVATILILVRSIYRLAELQEGFDGALANNETLFMILEGPMIFISILGLTVFHPGLAIGLTWSSLLKTPQFTDDTKLMAMKSGNYHGVSSNNSSTHDLPIAGSQTTITGQRYEPYRNGAGMEA